MTDQAADIARATLARRLLAAEYELGWPYEAERIARGADLTQAEKLAVRAISKVLNAAGGGSGADG